jgi:dTDP-4-dehydrorhamnose 3,5-epimerase
MTIEGTWEVTPRLRPDERGIFLETYRDDRFKAAVGHRFDLAQVNCSVSQRGTIRGIHFADVPPGQAKYVTCLHGSVLDVVVDTRVGSPTFGQWESVVLDETDRRAVYVAEGLGHAFMALSDGATVCYLCSQPYAPDREHGVHPLDPRLAIRWPSDIEPVISAKDSLAPTLDAALQESRLPRYEDCVAWYAVLRKREERNA